MKESYDSRTRARRIDTSRKRSSKLCFGRDPAEACGFRRSPVKKWRCNPSSPRSGPAFHGIRRAGRPCEASRIPGTTTLRGGETPTLSSTAVSIACGGGAWIQSEDALNRYKEVCSFLVPDPVATAEADVRWARVLQDRSREGRQTIETGIGGVAQRVSKKRDSTPSSALPSSRTDRRCGTMSSYSTYRWRPRRPVVSCARNQK